MALPATIETIFLLLAVFFPFYWNNQTYLSKFSLQLTGLLTLLFFLHGWINQKMYQMIIKVIIITIITLLMILSTGGAGSALFFLLDFLLFFVAIFFRPGAGLTLSLALTIAFLLNEPDLTQPKLINLVSLLLMAPLASFFSTQYRRLIIAQNEIKILSNQAKEEETAALIWLSLDFKNQLTKAIDLISLIKTNLSLIPYHQRDKLNQLYQDLKQLWLSGQELERKIDRIGDQ